MFSEKMIVTQNCWVVPDLDAAMHKWLGMGVGPFYVFEHSFPEALYRGRPVPLAMKVAMAQSGGVQIELIEPVSTGPCCYRDSVSADTEGFHHILHATADYDAYVAALKARGIVIANEFVSAGNLPACYADTRSEIGCMLEVVPDVPIISMLFGMVAAGAQDWDGQDPIRDGAEHMGRYMQAR